MLLPNPLAYAEPADPSNSGLVIVVIGAGVILAAAIAGLAPVAFAWSRRHRHGDAIVAAALLWAVLSAGSVIYTIHMQIKWSREQTLRIDSGYYDPHDNTDAPPMPWGIWIGLGSGYAAVWLWAVAAGNKVQT